MQNQRLTSFDTVTFRGIERDRHHPRFLQQGFIRRGNDEAVAGLTFTGDQLKRIAGEQGADVGVVQGELRTAHFDACLLAQEIDHARIDRHLAGDRAARIEGHFGELTHLQPLIHQRR